MKFLKHNPQEGIGGMGGRIQHHPLDLLEIPLIGQNHTMDIAP